MLATAELCWCLWNAATSSSTRQRAARQRHTLRRDAASPSARHARAIARIAPRPRAREGSPQRRGASASGGGGAGCSCPAAARPGGSGGRMERAAARRVRSGGVGTPNEPPRPNGRERAAVWRVRHDRNVAMAAAWRVRGGGVGTRYPGVACQERGCRNPQRVSAVRPETSWSGGERTWREEGAGA